MDIDGSTMVCLVVSATELGTKDRVCVQYMIKQLASQRSATTFATKVSAKYRGVVDVELLLDLR